MPPATPLASSAVRPFPPAAKGMPKRIHKGQRWRQVIAIPPADQSRLIQDWALSTRLRHVLLLNSLRTLGELNGRSFRDIGKLRCCGQKCLLELRGAVQQLQAQAGMVDAYLEPEPAKPMVQIPRLAHLFKLSDLPMSTRLEGVLRRCGFSTLGDADGMPIEELSKMKNCGRKSVAELLALAARAGAGEFSPTAGLAAAAAQGRSPCQCPGRHGRPVPAA